MQAQAAPAIPAKRSLLFGNSGLSQGQMKARLFYYLLALTLVDAIQTLWVINQVGVVAEANPIMRFALQNFDAYGLIWIKAFSVFLVRVFIERIRIATLIFAIALMATVVVTNLLQVLTLI